MIGFICTFLSFKSKKYFSYFWILFLVLKKYEFLIHIPEQQAIQKFRHSKAESWGASRDGGGARAAGSAGAPKLPELLSMSLSLSQLVEGKLNFKIIGFFKTKKKISYF